MAKRITRSFASFLRGWGNEQPDRGFTLGEQIQPVAVVADDSELMRRVDQPTFATRMNSLAAGAGRWSICALNASSYGFHIIKLHMGGNGRMSMVNTGDAITANRAAVVPPVQNRIRPLRTTLFTGDAGAEPIPAGSEFCLLATSDEITDFWVPPNHQLLVYGTAANQSVQVGWVVVREPADG